MKIEIDRISEVVQAKGLVVSDMDGETVMMSVTNGKYYNLGKTGGRIWELLAEPVTVNDVIESLMDEYDVERSECERQVIAFIQMLLQENLIEYIGETVNGHASSS